MDFAQFQTSLQGTAPPKDMRLALQALWWDARGDWEAAHRCAMGQDDAEGAAVHAYLHRKEGDLPNARYWYQRAGRAAAKGTLEQEWSALAQELAAQ